jgi:hypothetical protein
MNITALNQKLKDHIEKFRTDTEPGKGFDVPANLDASVKDAFNELSKQIANVLSEFNETICEYLRNN